MADEHFPVIAHRSVILRQLRARPRLFLSLLVGVLTGILFPVSLAPHPISRVLLAWNAGIVLYLVLAAVMIERSSTARMNWRARLQDEGRIVVLTGVILACLACLAAIVAELGVVKETHGVLRAEHIGLAILTLVSSWCFMHLMFAMHYAHNFYIDRGHGNDGGLQFPGTDTPHYLDFLYFAFVIGTSGQTADVSFSSTRMRRLGLLHCVLAYAFNTTVLALTINIASGLF